MATKIQKTKVGVFLVLCFGLIAVGLIVVGGMYENEGDHYDIFFNESVLGLTEGSPVVFLGVPVGKVDTISVTDEFLAHVQCIIAPGKITLREGVEAQLTIYSLAAGTLAVSLSGGEAGAARFPTGKPIPTKLSISTTVIEYIDEFKAVMENVSGIAEKIDKALVDLDEGQLTSIATKFETALDEGLEVLDQGKGFVNEATSTVSDLREDIKPIIENFKGISSDVRKLIVDLDELALTLNDKAKEFEVTATQERLNVVLENIGGVSEHLNSAMEQFDNVTANTMHQVDNVQHSVERALQDVSTAFDSLNHLVRQLKEDPASLVRGKANVKEEEK